MDAEGDSEEDDGVSCRMFEQLPAYETSALIEHFRWKTGEKVKIKYSLLISMACH
jgi:hypothetical protein